MLHSNIGGIMNPSNPNSKFYRSGVLSLNTTFIHDHIPQKKLFLINSDCRLRLKTFLFSTSDAQHPLARLNHGGEKMDQDRESNPAVRVRKLVLKFYELRRPTGLCTLFHRQGH